MTKERFYIIATMRLLNKNILQKPVDYIYNPKAKKGEPLFIVPTSEMKLEDFGMENEEQSRNFFDALIGNGSPIQVYRDDSFIDHSPSALMSALGAFSERISFQIDLELSKIIDNEDGDQIDKKDETIVKKRIHAGFVVC